MESVFAYTLTTDKDIIAKLHRNIKHDGVQLRFDKMGVAWRGLLLNFGTPSISPERLKLALEIWRAIRPQ